MIVVEMMFPAPLLPVECALSGLAAGVSRPLAIETASSGSGASMIERQSFELCLMLPTPPRPEERVLRLLVELLDEVDNEDDKLHPELDVLDVRERMLAVSDIAEVVITACV